MKTLITGGTGLLMTNIHLEAERPSSKELDIKQPITPKNYDLIIHAAAYTDVVKAEIERQECFEVNVKGTINLIKAYPKTPFVYISTEYAKNPVNYYSLTKRMAEDQLFFKHPCYLIVRTLFKPRPWKYPKAFVDQYTQGDYVDVIAPLIEKAIEDWDKKTSKIIYVGTGRKTIYDLAKQTRDVEPISVDDIKDVKIPKDYD